MNNYVNRAIKEDSFFCNHFLNIQLDFLLKLYYKTENPIVGRYIVKFIEKVKKYRFWNIIRPIIVDKNLGFWDIKFNYIPKKYIDNNRKILYLPSHYPRDDITYTFKKFKDEENYIKIHLDKIETFFTYEFNKLYKIYLENRSIKYDRKRREILKYMKDEYTIHSVFPIVKRSKISKVVVKNIGKKVVAKYINEISF